MRTRAFGVAAACLLAGAAGLAVTAGPASAMVAEDDFPSFETVSEGLTRVVSTADGSEPYWDLYEDRETGKLLGVLPRRYEGELFMIAGTISAGDAEAGVMGPTVYAEWKRFDKQLALVAPNLSVRTEGDKQAKDSIEKLYTGRVLLSVPIVTMHGGRPVIDLGGLATQQAGKVFGPSPFGGYGPSVRGVDPRLAELTKTKAFPENIVFSYRLPEQGSGQLVELTYSIGKIEGTPGYRPRRADSRVGYFYDWHRDFARPAAAELTDRYITRWNVEKADPSLKLSPPKEPIVWYIEHTTPVKFRRYVREGIEMWNDAFREIGIDGALEVYQQDSATGAHMDKDPEDARYNFFRWNASDQGYAIGPSRTDPRTGEILDADVVWHQGLTRAIRGMLENLSDDLTEQAFGAEDLAFFADHPHWDPRVRLSDPSTRTHRMHRLAAQHVAAVEAEAMTPGEHPWAKGLADHANTACRMGNQLSANISLVDAALAAGMLDSAGDDAEMLDGLPEEFIGPMIRYISAHEVGHCIGLQHNMAASTIRTLEEINSEGYDGPITGSVMDYAAVNINHELGEVQGPYATPVLGPYDVWAVAFGYGDEKDLDEVLSRVSEPDHVFVSQTAMSVGSDPRNMTWDMGKDNLNFAASRLSLVAELRGKLIEEIVDEGEPWAEARRRFQSLLGTHVQALVIAAPWVGGTYTNNDFKGDPGARPPLEDVPAAQQRRAMTMIMDYAFEDEAFGITPELVRHLGKEYWFDPQGQGETLQDPSYSVHDTVGGIQATGLSLLMSPTRLRRLYDNEFRVGSPRDTLTLAELVGGVTDNVWRECREGDREISSFRRNLQREHVGRLIDLALLDDSASPAVRTIQTLARAELRKIEKMAGKSAVATEDPYTAAHLSDIGTRIEKAMEAAYVVER